MEKTVYIIEDEEDIAKLIIYNLSLEGFKVGHFETGEEGLNAIQNNLPDLILLDLMLPGMSGFDICNEIKSNPSTKNIPIIMVSAKGEEEDIVKGLELGAEDYITKPFSPKVLIARVKTSLRRLEEKTTGKDDVIKIRDLVIHTGKHAVTISGKKVDLTPSEFQILHLLSSKTGWVFTRSQIVDAIRGDDYAVTDRTVDFQMVGLRKKMGLMGEDIETVRGIGYRFRE
jgi:two-component system phosphate regulon response regulator PhoB